VEVKASNDWLWTICNSSFLYVCVLRKLALQGYTCCCFQSYLVDVGFLCLQKNKTFTVLCSSLLNEISMGRSIYNAMKCCQPGRNTSTQPSKFKGGFHIIKTIVFSVTAGNAKTCNFKVGVSQWCQFVHKVFGLLEQKLPTTLYMSMPDPTICPHLN